LLRVRRAREKNAGNEKDCVALGLHEVLPG
jgi:hypothetical protein